MIRTSNMANVNLTRSGMSIYDRLESRLVLLDWLHHMLGYGSTAEMLQDLKTTEEGFAPDGKSYVYFKLISRGNKVNISLDALARYDANICAHLEKINSGRAEKITLRYFQYLAVLYSEVFLDYYFNRRSDLLSALNEQINQRNADAPAGSNLYRPFIETDLKKLAFWMATGSGKTLIMHINYWQFLQYNQEPLDNILLITPNEGLSEQHLSELCDSNIPSTRFTLQESGDLGTDHDTVRIIEITKLVSEARGNGASVPVETFEGNNLILVDEGHKGSGGDAWRRVRDEVGETGFTFEYSATFGQALAAAGDDDLVEEYGRAIVFDYSYRYFYSDGYGKDFHVINLQQEATEDQTHALLLANLLSFYEQQLIFAERGEDLRPYNLEKPLWAFVGGSVNAVYRKNGQTHSDVLTVVRFLHRLLADEKWVTTTISHLLSGKSGLKDAKGKDIFQGKFGYLRDFLVDVAAVYRDILWKMLHSTSGGGLHLCNIQGSKGELGLKAGGSNEYFGLIYVGDDSKFRKLIESNNTGIVTEDDAISGSLFSNINRADTTVEILVGAKKFMEGWNSWRVTNMGLLNIGKREGSQIVQLFGRGIRLRGRDHTLKRSSMLDGSHPEYIKPLETLNIFALHANYMAHFRDYLEREGALVHGTIEIQLPIHSSLELLGRDLVVPRLPEHASFADDSVVLDIDPTVEVRLDMYLKASLIASGTGGGHGNTDRLA